MAINTQPASQTVCAGASATFSVSVNDLQYFQWRRNGVNIPGATSSSYTLTATAPDNGAVFDVVCSNMCRTEITSAPATLTVHTALSITGQPVSQLANPGDSVSFSVVVSGSPAGYQWQKNISSVWTNLANSGNISGATTATLTLNPVVMGDTGSYRCVVTNECGTVNSDAATLAVCSPALTLNAADTCVNGSEQLVVNIDLTGYGAACPGIVAGQFFLQYDQSKLGFVSAVPGSTPWTREIAEIVNAGAGTIDYAVGTPVGDPNQGGTSGAMVTITFNAIAQTCATANLVTFRTHAPPTRLTDVNNADYDVPAGNLTLNALGAVTLDTTPPTATQGTISACYSTTALANAAALAATTALTDNCDPSPDKAIQTGATSCATSIVVRVTDDCGNYTDYTYTTRVDGTPPVVTCPTPNPLNLVAGPDGCNDTDPGSATALDNCDGALTPSYVRNDGKTLNEPFCVADSPILITWTATDTCGNVGQCVQTVTVLYAGQVEVEVQLAGDFTGKTFDRCVTFDLWACPSTQLTIGEVLHFVDGFASATITITPAYYECITARDRLHTLRKNDAQFHIDPVTFHYVAKFTTADGGDALVSGNANDDDYIDIIDFGRWATRYGTSYGHPNTTCSTPAYHVDFSGDAVGNVDELDYSFVQINFWAVSEAACCAVPGPAAGGDGPITRISVRDLIRMGQGDLAILDLNGDRWYDTTDVQLWLEGVRPLQKAHENLWDSEESPAVADF
jgi:hypothetical protein